MIYKNGVVLGRFQPFHKGHLEYVLKALKNCQILYIGITTPGKKLTSFEPQDINRLGAKNNPFSFSERKIMIKKALVEKNIDLKKIKFIDFRPYKIKEWFLKVPKDSTYFFLLISPTEKLKVDQMKAQGLNVVILGNINNRKHQAFDIRYKISQNKSWKHLVPNSVYEYLIEINAPKRLKVA